MIKNKWIKTSQQKPETGYEVLGYNIAWEDEDFNPDGICLSTLTNDGTWTVAMWNDEQEEYETHQTTNSWDGDKSIDAIIPSPTHWMPKPQKPKTSTKNS